MLKQLPLPFTRKRNPKASRKTNNKEVNKMTVCPMCGNEFEPKDVENISESCSDMML
jgi:hypothetical protein